MRFKNKLVVFPLILGSCGFFLSTGCGENVRSNDIFLETQTPDPDKIVPEKDTLVENLTGEGYSIETSEMIADSEISGERVYAEKDGYFIDISYASDEAEAESLFEIYEEYLSDDYYIIAQNGKYVYAVSDKKTFKLSGFTSTDNVGIQYISE